MDWLLDLFRTQDSVAHIVLLYSIVIAAGVYLGKIKVKGISLGVTFVLFAGILAGHIGFTAPTPVLNFLQDFGLILFVFMIGLQVGPGFFESFGRGGIKLNMLATSSIILNVAVMFACYFIFFDTSNVDNLPMMVGTMYGAVTQSPLMMGYYAIYALTMAANGDKVEDFPTAGYWYDASNMDDPTIAPNLYD